MKHSDAILNEITIGVIIPPPEVKKIIDKAAELVGRFGSSIEATFQNEDKNLPKFSFLKDGDPYRPYYLQRANDIAKTFANSNKTTTSGNIKHINDIKEEKFIGRKIGKDEDEKLYSQDADKVSQKSQFQDELRKIIEEKKLNKFITSEIKAPPKDQFSISHPNISSLEMDIIKITAQFVARNGQKFLSGLSDREMKNPQFDFLKPQHNLFGYFTYLVESYAKCLRKDDGNKAGIYFDDRETILKRATERYLWEKKQKEILKKKDQVDESERSQMAQIDWYDFTIVEVIEFTEEELYNTVPILNELDTTANMNINSIEANVNILMNMNNKQKLHEEEKISEQINVHPVSSIEEIETLSQDIPEPGMKIVKNYKRKIAENISAKKDQVKCPLCKESILIDEWPQHIKIELLDPKWREIQKELTERKIEMSLAPNSDFLGYLNEFSRYRPDLFGDVKDVVKIEEKWKTNAKAPNTVWDGIAPNISRTTANMAMLFQQNRKNIEESMKRDAIGSQGVRGSSQFTTNFTAEDELDENSRLYYLANGVPSNLTSNAIPLYVSKQDAKLNLNSQTTEKRTLQIPQSTNELQTSSTKLIPEDIFLTKNNKPFKLNIKLPILTHINKNYNGQIITILVEPKDLVSSLKKKIEKNLGENTNFEKIILKNLNDQELEDNRTFAYYNLTNNSFIELDI